MSTRHTARGFATSAGRAAFFTALGTAGGCTVACAAVHYRWTQVKSQSAYIDVIRDGFSSPSYLSQSFVASQVTESISRRRETSAFRRLVARLEAAIVNTTLETESYESPPQQPHVEANSSATHDLQKLLSRAISGVYSYLYPSATNEVPGSTPAPLDGIAFCRQRLDTPEYLIPYYLRSTQTRFNYYASKKDGGKFRRMDAGEFLRALLGQPKEYEVRKPEAAKGLQELFKTIDTNGDGELSLKEFSFFLTLLATPRDDYITGFQMFNQQCSDPSGVRVSLPSNPLKASLNFEEFCFFMETKGDGKNSRPRISNALIQKLFGETGARRCTSEALLVEVDKLKEAVWRAEFLQYVDIKEGGGIDSSRIGVQPTITAESFGHLIASHLVGQHLPIHLVKNIRKLKRYDEQEDAVELPLQSWFSLSKMMEQVDSLGTAVRVYSQATGKDLNRHEFARAVKAAHLPAMSTQEIDLLFTLFDANNDGTISYEEFEQLAKMRIGMHVRSRIEAKGEGRENFLPTLMKCTSEALFAGKV